MNGTIFVLEDDASICGLVKVALEMNGLQVKTFGSLASFTDALNEQIPDVALLDVMLPDGSGLDALKAVKSKRSDAACIMLTAMGKEEDKVNGLNMGADDYVTKPFSVLELLARINACLRRKKSSVLTVANVTIDADSFACSVDGKSVALNRKEFELLKTLMSNAGKVLTREFLLTAVWGYDVGETRTLDNHVARLRKAGIPIDTVFGVGYKMG